MDANLDGAVVPPVRSLEDQISTTVASLQSIEDSLDVIKDNTMQVFWWLFVLVWAVLGLLIFTQLVRLRNDMIALVQHQELFRKMWDEEREEEKKRREEEKAERREEEKREKAGEIKGEIVRRRSRMFDPAHNEDGKGKSPAMPRWGRTTGGSQGSPTSATGSQSERWSRVKSSGPEVEAVLDTAPPTGAEDA
ncbi:hypothetical protein GGR54DRAFT_330930 [Hypoxylon sp. NC1633]|nr:hypothetical protein GGR54DRAFT_330930 [Hypoxylon sp. NC1633]